MKKFKEIDKIRLDDVAKKLADQAVNAFQENQSVTIISKKMLHRVPLFVIEINEDFSFYT